MAICYDWDLMKKYFELLKLLRFESEYFLWKLKYYAS